MSQTIPQLPAAQLAPLSSAYAKAVAAKRNRFALGCVFMLAAIAVSARIAEVDIAVLGEKIGNFTGYIVRIAHLESGKLVLADAGEWLWGWKRWLRLIGETLLIAYLGTIMGVLGAFLLCFSAAANLASRRWVIVVTRRFLEFCRTVPEIVFALIFVVAFGLGPLPGILALSIHSLGALGKLFSEVVENIDMKPVEGLASTGAGHVATIRFAVVPQILSNFVSYALLRFEVNVRGAAVMGFVGAGGIGQDLIEAIRKFYYSDVSAILLFIVITVVAIDLVTERIRHALLGMEARV